MKKRVALLSIIVSDITQTGKLNEYLHEASEYIIGRMGIPYRERNINIISVAVDAPQDMISALSGKIGKLKGVSSRTTYSDVITVDAVESD
ncbi:MAG TPA: iron-only hydrogenase system regulator [Lachnospiraceae bacterium]|jgi:putative iron-only hydrogenase system regulator|nr:iron-only hydrogenase system regulator [Lachnospiraceae bacterium]